ncbi:sugar-phosphatase [Enterococcus xiangfangensis]|uniref:Sugar-phosphatase n=1 Tax=Enterococcus xiangfangensis TaxID=1296537 RepID=A0ABU3F6G9_9ENTE|nr:sugar-phosphatase [Enterococcus xiangfangensis]MDT2758258.1 sugar-phosphatase [Enterococcus xiangfangensis]
MSIKLVAIDLDGTLLNDHHEINAPVVECIKAARKAGVYVVLSTGRPLSGTKAQLEVLGLTEADDYIITYNGALVLNTKTWDIVAEHSLTRDNYLEIDHLARLLGVHLHVTDKKAMYTANRDISPYTVVESYLVNMPLHYRTPEEIAKNVTAVKMMMIDDPAILSEAFKQIPAEYFEKYTLVRSSPYFLEVLNSDASKGLALKELSEHLGIQQAEVMAIGDAENDLSMIEFAGTGIAMGNASEMIKAAADYTVATNLEDGVKEAFDRWVLN